MEKAACETLGRKLSFRSCWSLSLDPSNSIAIFLSDIICIITLWGKTLNFNFSRSLPENLIFPNYQCREIIFIQAVEISANWFSSIKMQLNNLILLRQRREGKEKRVGEKWIERSLGIINCTWNHCWNVFLSIFPTFCSA